MGFGLSLLVAVTSFLTAPSLDPNSARDSQYLETLVFNTSLPAFIEILHEYPTRLGWFDQSSDLCSAPIIGSTGRSFNFTQACERHDFAYRNYKLMDTKYSCFARLAGHFCAPTGEHFAHWWNGSTRLRIDERFASDMSDHCATRSIWDRPICRAWAHIFFRMVRLFGGP
ncbi:MAG: phospholipase A2 [Actinomycetes bacterium]